MQPADIQTWLRNRLSGRTDVRAAVLMLAGQNGLAVAARWPDPASVPAALPEAAQHAFAAARAVLHTIDVDDGGRIEAHPVRQNGKTIGAVALALVSQVAQPAFAAQDAHDSGGPLAEAGQHAWRADAEQQAVPVLSALLVQPSAAAEPAGDRPPARQATLKPARASAERPAADSPWLPEATEPLEPLAPTTPFEPIAPFAPVEPLQRAAAEPAPAASVGAAPQQSASQRNAPPTVATVAPTRAVPHWQPLAVDDAQRPVVQAAQVLEVLATALAQPNFASAAAAAATALADLLGCERAMIGWRKRGFVQIEAVSRSADLREQGELLTQAAAAMDEALDQAATIRHPQSPHDPPRITLAGAELARRHGSSALCCVPLLADDRLLGALLSERRDGLPFDDHTVGLLESAALMLGPLLALKRNSERAWHERAAGSTAAFARRLTGPGHWPLKATLASMLAGAIAMTFVSIDYRVAATARLEGAVQRTLVASADGFLKGVNVRPGDAVRTDQLLAELSDEDLRLERRRWESEIAKHDNAQQEALARADRAQLVIAAARAAEARAQLALTEQRLARARIVAPFDGIVIQGDLTQQLGAPVKRGDVLLTVAPAADFRVIVEVDERDIGNVRVGSTGRITLSALPAKALPIHVVRITPVAVAADGRNYFEVEARFDEQIDELRPGLEGVAKLDVGQRPAYWVVGHRAYDWLRLAVWSWTR